MRHPFLDHLRMVFVVMLLSFPAWSATIIIPHEDMAIQDAIDCAGAGDLILVEPGTYFENISFKGKAIRLESLGGPAVTTIDGMRNGPVVSFVNGETGASAITGFTLTNGSGVVHAGKLHGGAIICGNGSSPTLSGNVCTGNNAYHGGAIACWLLSAPVIAGNTFSGNGAQYGGAIHLDEASPSITGNTFETNEAVTHGGAIYCRDGSDPLIDGNTFSDNGNRSGRGGAIYSYKASPAITNNTVADNHSYKCGGGIYGRNSNSLVQGNRIFRNRSETAYGGGINFSSGSMPVIARNIINGNRSVYGGGINCYYSCNGSIVNNLIVNNHADARGGAINCDEGTTLTIMNNTIASNSAASSGGGFSCNKLSHATVVNTILWSNDAPLGTEIYLGTATDPSTLSISYTDIKGGTGSIKIVQGCVVGLGPGNINADPSFVERATGDFHLSFNSPCRDAGNGSARSLPQQDFEGDPRTALAAVDLGADEFHTHLYAAGPVMPGSPIDIRIVGEPKKSTTLALGSGVQDPPQNTPHGPLCITLPMLNKWTLQKIPATGVLNFTMTIPGSWTAGDYPLQALIGPWGGTRSRLTNLLVLTVE